MKPHEHKDLILKWADGAEIEAYAESRKLWVPATTPTWQAGVKYRLKPAAPVVETNMAGAEMEKIYDSMSGENWYVRIRALLNAAVARAIADGQVVPKEEYDRLAAQYTEVHGLAFELQKRGAERDMAVAEAVRDAMQVPADGVGFGGSDKRKHVFIGGSIAMGGGGGGIRPGPIDLAAIIARVK